MADTDQGRATRGLFFACREQATVSARISHQDGGLEIGLTIEWI
jgi:hypothetical protein